MAINGVNMTDPRRSYPPRTLVDAESAAVLEEAIEAGQLPSQPARAAAYVVVGALEEAAMTIARDEDPLAARGLLRRLSAG